MSSLSGHRLDPTAAPKDWLGISIVLAVQREERRQGELFQIQQAGRDSLNQWAKIKKREMLYLTCIV